MQAVILAAGLGKRLGSLTQDSAKCMVEVNGRKVIDHMLEAIMDVGIKSVIVVTGHGEKGLKAHLNRRFKDLKIAYVHNKDYATTNNIYSLILAKKHMVKDDSLLFESDLMFDRDIIIDCLNEQVPNSVVVAKYQSWMDGTVVKLDDEGYVSGFVLKKDFNWQEVKSYYKTVNIYKLSKEFASNALFPFLESYIKMRGKQEYYENVLKVLTFIESHKIHACEVGDRLWYEIDDIQDLDIASTLFAPEAQKFGRFEKRYGGYWRFPKFLDFCYLINPYFPTEKIYDEMRNELPRLIADYPSGAEVLNILASRLTGCDRSRVVVGNGACELINMVMSRLDGQFGIPTPCFNEYPRIAGEERIEEFSTIEKGFRYNAADLKRFCKERSVRNLVLVNPDNPSGQFIKKNELIKLLGASRKNIRLILDESFVDFVDGTDGNSLLDDEILAKYPNLIVIKSLSKSFGIGGLRLGILATADRQVLDRVKGDMPIWNINSIAEFFLQIQRKHEADYREACKKLAAERTRVMSRLKRISFLKPYPSQANFILCEVASKEIHGLLLNELLVRMHIFIKDCSTKKGFNNKPYIRITVRNEGDNNRLLRILREIDGLIRGREIKA